MNHHILFIIYIIFNNIVYAENCSCCITESYFNESIMYNHISMLDINSSSSYPLLYKYDIISDDCVGDIAINVEYKLISTELGINTFETFYKGKINLETSSKYFTNTQLKSGTIPQYNGNSKIETLISYFSKSGKLPNGKYIFYFTLNTNSQSFTESKIIDIYIPHSIKLISPGTEIQNIANSFIHSTFPVFNWYSDFSSISKYEIRISEYNPNYHESLQDAISKRSIVPHDQSVKFLSIGYNTNSFQYPSIGNVNLEIGKYYVWQIRRSFESTLGTYYVYSPINVFEIRDSDNLNIDYSDKYIAIIKSIIGKEKFNLWFNSGGELDRFITSRNTVIINNEEVSIDILYSILSELQQGKIIIEDVKVK